MPEFAMIGGGYAAQTYGSVGASTTGTTLTAGGSPNTKGAYVELTSSTTHDANWCIVYLTSQNAVSQGYLVDVAIGSATEEVIIPDLSCWGKANSGWNPYMFPIFVPRGSRLAARCQCNVASGTINITVQLISGALSSGAPSGIVSAYGSTIASIGTNIDPGASAHTKSSWVEISSATTRDHNWLVASARFGDSVISGATNWMFDIGIGAATETVLISDAIISSETAADFPQTVFHWPIFIPAGSRLTARVQSSVTTDGDRDIWLKLYGC